MLMKGVSDYHTCTVTKILNILEKIGMGIQEYPPKPIQKALFPSVFEHNSLSAEIE